VQKRIYCYKKQKYLHKNVYIKKHPRFLIIEGIYVTIYNELKPYIDCSIYINTNFNKSYTQRIERDKSERKVVNIKREILHAYYIKYIIKQKNTADLILSGSNLSSSYSKIKNKLID